MSQLSVFGGRPSDATIEGAYRYDLLRSWGETDAGRLVNFVMLNPSTADASLDDPTIRRCIGFAKGWGYGGLVVTNLYAYRATDPKELARVSDPVGPRNDEFIRRWAGVAEVVVCAWGASTGSRRRAAAVLDQLRADGAAPVAIRLTKDGHPSHPLYLPANLGHVSLA